MTTTPAKRDERQLFESAYLKEYFYPAERWSLVPEKYRTEHADIAWRAWQQRAALAESELAEVREQLAAANDKIDKAWNRTTPVLDGFIPGALDAWKRPVKQFLPYDFSGNRDGLTAIQYCNGWNDSGGYWKAHVSTVEAERDELRAELERVKASEAAAHKEVIRYHWLRKQTPYRFKKIQDASLIDGGDVVYFHSGNFTAAIDAARGVEG